MKNYGGVLQNLFCVLTEKQINGVSGVYCDDATRREALGTDVRNFRTNI